MEQNKPIPQTVLVAGATGYLGRFIADELVRQGYNTKVIVRDKARAEFDEQKYEVLEVQITRPAELQAVMDGVGMVASNVGITRQKDGLTYMDVDYQANANLLAEAKKSEVKRFLYVAVLGGNKLLNLKICQAKERFVNELKNSGISPCIVRPTGYFSDMGDFLKMAQKGTMVWFGSGAAKMNPIDGADLAEVCVDALQLGELRSKSVARTYLPTTKSCNSPSKLPAANSG